MRQEDPRPTRYSHSVEKWLTGHGWHPARDIGFLATEAIDRRKEQLAGQGHPLEPHALVEPFLHSYGLLELPVETYPSIVTCFDPSIAYAYDGEDIVELGEGLRRRVFPVGFMTEDGNILVLDDLGRFFAIHHTGSYFVGHDTVEAVTVLKGGGVQGDAEDFFP
ncbi:SUKH-3 domain-containing protein [Streptomyces sp. URMC 126]|uniref:SUKH-3 domain-containing protein n=1 Tax=Streptomyces sp. URMC 126 TaxID=3423401 RepID=UPI003F1DF55F